MGIRKIEDIYISSIIKNNLYLNGLIVEDDIYDLLKSSQYSGYLTTTGIFMKIGGTLSKDEYLNTNKSTLFSYLPNNLSYEDYLKYREYTTTSIRRESDINKDELINKTYFILSEVNGNLKLSGQYVYNNKIYHIELDDCGFFKQDNFKDDPVMLQAGGIRLKDSLCNSNCISGCSFCSFGKNYKFYRNDIFNDNRKKYILNRVKSLTINSNIDTLFITGGNPSLSDLSDWTLFLKDNIDVFRENSSTCNVDVMLTPRGFDKYVYNINRYKEYKNYLEYLKEIGVTTLSPNMELWRQEDLDKFCPVNEINIGTTKSEIGHDGYMDFIRASIEVFGKYNIRTSLIAGLNSLEDIKLAIDELIPIGCNVIISPLKPLNKYFYKYNTNYNDLIELSNYLNIVTNKTISSYSNDLACIFRERLSRCLNAHNGHNTANLCLGQDLDNIEKKVLKLGYNNDIINHIK
jgi:hypothetical protein